MASMKIVLIPKNSSKKHMGLRLILSSTPWIIKKILESFRKTKNLKIIMMRTTTNQLTIKLLKKRMSCFLGKTNRIKIKKMIKSHTKPTINKEIPLIYTNKKKNFPNFPANFPPSTKTRTRNLSTHKIFNKTKIKLLVNMKLKKNRFCQPITSV